MNIKHIIEEKIANAFRTDKEFITSTRRTRGYCDARKVYCHILYCEDAYSLNQVAERLGYRDHSTVIHNLKAFKSLHETDAVFKAKADGVIDFYRKLIKYENKGKDLQHTPIGKKLVADSIATND